MNPWSSFRGFRKGRNTTQQSSLISKKKRQEKRRTAKGFLHKSARLKDSYGAVEPKKSFSCVLLNADGFSEQTFMDVKETLAKKLK